MEKIPRDKETSVLLSGGTAFKSGERVSMVKIRWTLSKMMGHQKSMLPKGLGVE